MNAQKTRRFWGGFGKKTAFLQMHERLVSRGVFA